MTVVLVVEKTEEELPGDAEWVHLAAGAVVVVFVCVAEGLSVLFVLILTATGGMIVVDFVTGGDDVGVVVDGGLMIVSVIH